MSKLNLFATVLTYAAPSSNYRGESEESRTVLQTLPVKGKNHAIISSESMRNALRELLAIEGLPSNRERLHDYIDKEGKTQLAVKYTEFPDPEKYADDFFFGFLVAAKDKTAIKKYGRSKRDSVFRMNLALALSPFSSSNNATFHQSPKMGGDNPPFINSNENKAGIYYIERTHTAYQYPFALAGRDCEKGNPEWTKTLLKCIGQLNNVAGGHKGSKYEMSPKSIVVRLTSNLVAGFDTYGFDENGGFAELKRINENDLPGGEFWIGGELARNMDAGEKERLSNLGVHFYDNPQTLLEKVGEEFLK